MDTIIYLKAERQIECTCEDTVSMFHIMPVRMWEVPQGMGGGMDNLQILYVTIPLCTGRKWGSPMQLAAYLVPFFGYSTSIETILHSSMDRYLLKECREEWQHSWPYPIFREYRRLEYGQFLMGKGMEYFTELINVYVLGYEEFTPQMLKPYLKKIKSLTFFVTEGQCGLEDYLENLYEEEGLAADCRILLQKEFCRLRLWCEGTALVIDFSGEEKIIPSSVNGRLVWLDMDSNETKKRKIEGRCAESAYFSMKEAWGRLDTAWKNRYNT